MVTYALMQCISTRSYLSDSDSDYFPYSPQTPTPMGGDISMWRTGHRELRTYIYIIYIASRFSTYKMNTHFMFFVNLLMFTNKWQQKRVDIQSDIRFSLCYHWISMFGGNWKMPAPVPAYSAEFQITIIFFMPWPVPGLHADMKRNFFFAFLAAWNSYQPPLMIPTGKRQHSWALV